MATINLDIRIQSGNDAFQADPHGELARIIRQLADALSEVSGPPNCCSFTSRRLLDVNGNYVGFAEIGVVVDDE